ncbi:MAG: hypothetical protein GWM88_00510 [Pseudomonadales bacterium]|nr:hypothetical protein [Pseudomonadales bacterium]NIX06580.1 hypothetical protein [Pseudomonadales bacterium]
MAHGRTFPLVMALAAGGTSVGAQVASGPDVALSETGSGLPSLRCEAEQTGGFHDYPGEQEAYEPALFNPGRFTLEENVVFMLNLPVGNGAPDLYLVMRTDGELETELACRRVRGADGAMGYSCVNTPPSEMLLINRETLRFTRTAVGGWTFAGATESLSGDSIFVEYGACLAEARQAPAPDLSP